MNLDQRIQAFTKLHDALIALDEDTRHDWARKAESHNGWFQSESVFTAIKGLIRYLKPESLQAWVANYDVPEQKSPKKIGVIMAGNIPMVGIHDFIAVLLSGHELHAKLSSQDPFLIKAIAEMLIAIEPAFESRIHFIERMNQVDALIATGSDNSARYFEYYFKDKPKIIRKNRTSVAVINGKESKEALKQLADDVLTYFGLGCRNVSKLYVPKGYDLIPVLAALEPLANQALNNHKYANNYDYNKSIYLVNNVTHLDTGGLLATSSTELVSPISVLYYEEYKDQNAIEAQLRDQAEKIQCIVSEKGQFPNSLPFGQAQCPQVNDYADGVDTMAFLLKL